jgi:branched-chain amino acid aminotransferase
VARAELVLADEVFLVGTAAELTPVREIDDIELGPPGEVTRRVQEVYDDALCGRVERYSKWLDVVPVPSKA